MIAMQTDAIVYSRTSAKAPYFFSVWNNSNDIVGFKNQIYYFWVNEVDNATRKAVASDSGSQKAATLNENPRKVVIFFPKNNL